METGDVRARAGWSARSFRRASTGCGCVWVAVLLLAALSIFALLGPNVRIIPWGIVLGWVVLPLLLLIQVVMLWSYWRPLATVATATFDSYSSESARTALEEQLETLPTKIWTVSVLQGLATVFVLCGVAGVPSPFLLIPALIMVLPAVLAVWGARFLEELAVSVLDLADMHAYVAAVVEQDDDGRAVPYPARGASLEQVRRRGCGLGVVLCLAATVAACPLGVQATEALHRVTVFASRATALEAGTLTAGTVLALLVGVLFGVFFHALGRELASLRRRAASVVRAARGRPDYTCPRPDTESLMTWANVLAHTCRAGMVLSVLATLAFVFLDAQRLLASTIPMILAALAISLLATLFRSLCTGLYAYALRLDEQLTRIEQRPAQEEAEPAESEATGPEEEAPAEEAPEEEAPEEE